MALGIGQKNLGMQLRPGAQRLIQAWPGAKAMKKPPPGAGARAESNRNANRLG